MPSNNKQSSVVLISEESLDWIKRNPRVFVDGLIGRLENGETDPYPGHSRWNGDAMPGVQVVTAGKPGTVTVVAANEGFGRQLFMVNDHGQRKLPSTVEVLKIMAQKLGYNIRKKPSTGTGNNKQKNKNAKFYNRNHRP